MAIVPKPQPKLLTGLAAWWDTLFMATRKELLIMLRYPVELIASFVQMFVIVIVLTLAGLMFTEGGVSAAGSGSSRAAGRWCTALSCSCS